MGRLKHYRNCEVVIAPEEEPLKHAVGCEDEMVHQELKCCNAHNELGKQNNGKRFLTDREIKALVEQFVKDDDIIAQTYDEIAKRRKDKDFKLLEDRDMENLGSLSFSADGYVAFSVYDTGWELGRLRKGAFTVRHEIGLEGK